MTDRDTFAAAALTGILSQCAAEDRDRAATASLAYRHADAMLRERGSAPEDCETVRYRLTDEEREAVEWCADRWHTPAYTAATLRKLLERFA